MTSRNEPAEGRQHGRFQVPTDAFVAFPPDYYIVGQIVDISMGGLSISYIADEEHSERSFELDIFLAVRRFDLQGVPFRTVWDFKSEPIPSGSAETRRSGLQFGDLTPDQMSQLEYFIHSYGTGKG
jgi:hypothetical protein